MTTPEPTPEAVEALAGIHGQHRYVDVRGDYEAGDGRRYFGCSCGWTHDVDGMSGYWSWVEEHERHVARAVLAAGYVSPDEHRRDVEHWKDHAEEAGRGFTQVCQDSARIAARNADLRAENERLRAQVARVREVQQRINALADLAAKHLNCSGCPTPWWLTNWLAAEASARPVDGGSPQGEESGS